MWIQAIEADELIGMKYESVSRCMWLKAIIHPSIHSFHPIQHLLTQFTAEKEFCTFQCSVHMTLLGKAIRYAMWSPVSWKYVLYYAKKKMKTRGIDIQKWTLAFICYAHFWRAYNTQFLRAYHTKFVGVHIICRFRVHMIRIYTTTLTLPIA